MTAAPIRTGLLVAAAMLVAAVLLKGAGYLGLISHETVVRAAQALLGLMLAVYGNAMPKALPKGATGGTQTVLRVGGWAFTLAGLAYAGLSLFAPATISTQASVAAVVVAMVISLAAVVWVGVTSARTGSHR